jgi:HAD superfamily hydrolase (TIGR01662 family)
MITTSVAIPPAATIAYLRGLWRHRKVRPWPGSPRVVFFDRDGTLVEDVPYNGDPEQVRPMPGAETALRRLRSSGVRTGVVTNQSGIGRGLLTADEVARVNARVDALLGPFDVWAVCPHGPTDGCRCRKPAAGLLHCAAAAVDVPLAECALVGDIGSDVAAARAAGVRGVLVPTAVTMPSEIAEASLVAADLEEAVALLLGEAP